MFFSARKLKKKNDEMAHRKNSRSLRQNQWRTPIFCQYAGRKDTREVWGKKLPLRQKRNTFFPKTHLKRQKNFFVGKKKNSLLLKDVRTTFFVSHYNLKRVSLLSPNFSRPVQNRLKKFKKQKPQKKILSRV